MLLLCAIATVGRAADEPTKEVPLWEFGLGLGAVAFEDYRGSKTTHAYPVPTPYFRYNGEFLKADREGIRGTFFIREWLELNLSGNATTPGYSERIRSGMPTLKSTLEVGPALDFHLLRADEGRIKLDLLTPVRAAFVVESPPHSIGWTFTPRVNLDILDPFGYTGWNFGVQAGPLFADYRYNDYFYEVAPQYATLARPAYQARGGYTGSQAVTALSKRFPKFWFGAYLRYDTLAGAAFADSPLVQTKSYWSGGFGFAWMLGKSSEIVEVPK